jgi:hypothetical protein
MQNPGKFSGFFFLEDLVLSLCNPTLSDDKSITPHHTKIYENRGTFPFLFSVWCGVLIINTPSEFFSSEKWTFCQYEPIGGNPGYHSQNRVLTELIN